MNTQAAPPVQRLRITFAVDGPAKYVPHLDITRAWVRALRRLGLAVAYSHGYHPHPRVALAAPLPVGYAAERELLEVFLDQPIPPEELAARLRGALPGGLSVREVEAVPLQSPPLASQIVAAEYTVVIPHPPADLQARLERVLAAESLPFTRVRKDREVRFDLRPRILHAEAEQREGEAVLTLRLTHGPEGAARPEDVISALGMEWGEARATRRRLILA